ncbi:alpha/beta hydrolase [Chryseobacterium tongliaoense]|uniref:alpha/beta hydrolase n=1 Tax=Chryseobacterium tongliaoense TaxID=3240933 RepID=UPI0035159A61
MKQILFIHGGGDDGYGSDSKMLPSLEQALGADFKIHYPKMPEVETNALATLWLEQIDIEVSGFYADLILVGHSLGASMLLKYLSEFKIPGYIKGVFLIAPPFWNGTQDWIQPLKLKDNFAEKLPKDLPVFFYQTRDDTIVPYEQFARYKIEVPRATFREIPSGGHQFNNDLSIVAMDIIAMK